MNFEFSTLLAVAFSCLLQGFMANMLYQSVVVGERLEVEGNGKVAVDRVFFDEVSGRTSDPGFFQKAPI